MNVANEIAQSQIKDVFVKLPVSPVEVENVVLPSKKQKLVAANLSLIIESFVTHFVHVKVKGDTNE